MVAKSGETVLIGGLIQDTTIKTRSEVPCLGDLPLLGLLFGSRKRSVDKTELVILITPTVVDRKKKSVAELEAIMRFNQAEEKMKQEPLPPYRQIWEFTKPWDKTIDKPQESVDLNSSESP
jgi:type II secretory pathway component GspD/PulD (secretin)